MSFSHSASRRGCSWNPLPTFSTMMLLVIVVSMVEGQVSAFSPSSSSSSLSSSSQSLHESVALTKSSSHSSSKSNAQQDPQQQLHREEEYSEPVLLSRRQWWYSTATKAVALSSSSSVAIASGVFGASPAPAAAADSATGVLLDELKSSKDKLTEIPPLLQNQEWDKVRTILKTPPVNKLWNLGDSQNTILKLAKESGDVDLFELKDELALSLQMCDQLT